MSNIDRDPVQAVKAFLHLGSPQPSSVEGIAPDLRELRERLGRARRVESRVSLSEILEGLVAPGERPVA
jgi:hypothetical protein